MTATDPMIALNGRLICRDAQEAGLAREYLPEHIALSRAEAGCLRFDLWQEDDPAVWHLSELFVDPNAFAAHQARTAASEWGRQSAAVQRDFTKQQVTPFIRPEQPADVEPIDALLRMAFGGDDEAELVAALRRQGDLTFSLVAEAAGTVLGHLGMSPVSGDHPALALAPVAVLPKAQRRSIGGALIRRALGDAGQLPVIVLGDPGYYRRFGFSPAKLDSPYAGPYLQLYGTLPQGANIRHAPAFSGI